MGIDLILTILGGIVSLVGVYYRMENKVNLLEQKIDNRDLLLNKLEKTLEKLNQNQESLNETLIELKTDFKYLVKNNNRE